MEQLSTQTSFFCPALKFTGVNPASAPGSCSCRCMKPWSQVVNRWRKRLGSSIPITFDLINLHVVSPCSCCHRRGRAAPAPFSNPTFCLTVGLQPVHWLAVFTLCPPGYNNIQNHRMCHSRGVTPASCLQVILDDLKSSEFLNGMISRTYRQQLHCNVRGLKRKYSFRIILTQAQRVCSILSKLWINFRRPRWPPLPRAALEQCVPTATIRSNLRPKLPGNWAWQVTQLQ